MKRFLQIFLTTAIVMMTAFLVTDAVSPSRNYNVVDNIFLHSTSSYDDALYIADEYNLELIEYSEYGYSIYQNTYQDDTYLLSNGFSYDSYSTVDESPWKTTTTEDPYLKNQYGLEVTNTIETWGLTEGSSQVLIAIIDTGIDINHPEFQGRISTLSKNVVTNTVGITAVDDDYGHGTMVAGIIGAIKDNSTGIAGITQNTMLLVLKANE
ncbi:MAG TPA: S8 family serine peptidase, partial [Bacillota bacterium]|nr:S8 family serine peptidase [Bacillota bacterium]